MATKKKAPKDEQRPRATKDEPYTRNYPPLEKWLEKNAQACQWQMRLGAGIVECWLVNGRPVIITVYSDKKGWDMYTSLNTNKIDETLADAEKRLSITDPVCPGCGWSISAVAKTVNCNLGKGCKCGGSARAHSADAMARAGSILERMHSEHECNTAEDAEELAKLVLGVDE